MSETGSIIRLERFFMLDMRLPLAKAARLAFLSWSFIFSLFVLRVGLLFAWVSFKIMRLPGSKVNFSRGRTFTVLRSGLKLPRGLFLCCSHGLPRGSLQLPFRPNQMLEI